MFIKSIVLDGFKSYGNRVEITGFDPEFNAITGLNGTGKSNILDSICFVLGITNLSNVRAGSLQELIYKHGQAGITKATVSITFDNRNKSQCPVTYETYDEITVTRQVVMGGKNKYMINGVNVQNKKVSDLFCSVQLNVNNPHFLIMQGRITKVLNMKPPEILSMIEEAAGTRMYEAKKQAAQKTIERKDAKLRELNEILAEDIGPKLQKLQDERSQFQEYQKVVRELDNLTKLSVAYNYVTTEQLCGQAAEHVSHVNQQIQDKKESIKNNEVQAKELDKQVHTLTKKLDEENGNLMKTLQEELSELERSETLAATSMKAVREETGETRRRVEFLRGALGEETTALQQRTTDLEQVSSLFSTLKSKSEAATAALNVAMSRHLAVSTGLEGDSTSLHDKLSAAKEASIQASTRLEQISNEKKHLESRLRSKETEFEGHRSQFDSDTVNLTRHQNEINAILAQMSSLNFDCDRHQSLVDRNRSLESEVRAARRRHEAAYGGLSHCDITYTDPEQGFDRNRILGTVCRNFEVNDFKYSTALETAAGGKLYNVIVDTEVTGRMLVDKGRLAKRVTVIPLNQIQGRVIPKDKLKLAQKIKAPVAGTSRSQSHDAGGPDKVQLALDVISHSSEVTPAMKYVFGSTLLCSDLDVARAVTFHPGVRARCVTLQGDVTDPGGSLSGGALPKGDPILVRLKKLLDAESELKELEAELKQVSQNLTSMQAKADTYRTLKQKQEMLSYDLGVLTRRIETSSHGQLNEEITTMKERKDQLEAEVAQVKNKLKEANREAAELQKEVDDIKGHRDREFKKAEADLKKAQAEAKKHDDSWKQRQEELGTLKLEVTELQNAVAKSQKQLEDSEHNLHQLQESLKEAQEKHNQAMALVKEAQSSMKRHQKEMSSRSGEINALVKRKEDLLAANNDTRLEITQLTFNLTERQNEEENLKKRLRSLESENPWISEEKTYFGVAGGVYDFKGRGAESAGSRVEQLTARRDRLARGVNARAHTLLGKEEEQYQDVIRKKHIVEHDRAKLVSVMEELDEKKRITLLDACAQVNTDFGSIFSTLLPGAQARLQPPHGQTVLDGLEVKVGFNDTWKESLGELSGGQRSLVALSLVLAMLMFKPAPLYILDEVDAALDLSHTQNIGHMLKEHFTHSQFIVVSLKDGMFNNANVLFRTQFVDGMSTVQRTVNTRR